jgi:S-formylglutathione hydrolase
MARTRASRLAVLSVTLVLVTGVAAPRGQAPSQTSAPLPANVRTESLTSAALHRALPYRVVLPARYSAAASRYPVLYLLHGYGGHFTNWTEKTGLVEAASPYSFIVVTPEGENSWYVDGVNGEAWNTCFSGELVTDVDRKFRTIARRDGRAIAGLSMGGYGSVLLGLQHPSEYVFVGSVSGALDITRANDVFTRGSHVDVTPIFGPPGSATRQANDVYALIASADPRVVPYFYMAEGAQDPWLEPNREFVRALVARGVAHEYHETPGSHDWTFWGREIRPLLARLQSVRATYEKREPSTSR